MRIVMLLSSLILAVSARAEPVAPPAYDATLAQRLGADERGMKMYVLVILRTGPNANLPNNERAKLFQGHMANIKRLAQEGKLVIAGPFEENDRHYKGIFIFNVAKKSEAEVLLGSDPAVAAGVLSFDAYGWYGSAALQEVTAIHGRIDKTNR